VFLRAGVSPPEAERRLVAADLAGTVVRHDRGAVADGEIQDLLMSNRRLAYALMAVVGALRLLIASHLDAAERRIEIATLVALGAGRRTVAGALLARAVLVATVGALLGVGIGTAAAAFQDASVAAGLVRAWPIGLTTLAAAVILGSAAAVPRALAAALRDPVPELQEG